MSKNKEYKSIIDDDSYDYTPSQEESKKDSSLSKRTKLIIVLAAFLAVMIPVYLFVLAPMLKSDSNTPGNEIVEPDCHYTETVYNRRYICMMPMLGEEEISKVRINNKVLQQNGEYEYAGWELFYNAESELWGITDYTQTSFDKNYLSTVMWYLTIMLTTDRIEYSSFDEIDKTVYGFDDGSMPVSYEIITSNGKSYKVTRGNLTATGSGFYAYYTDENGVDRPTVYIISEAYGLAMNSSPFDSVAPTVTQLLDQKDYVPSQFEIRKANGECFTIKKLTDEEVEEYETVKLSHLYITLDGKDYRFEASAYYSTMLYDILQPGINGTRVVYAKADGLDGVPREMLEKYGIDEENPYIQLYFVANAVFSTGSSHSTQQWVQFSEKTTNEDGEEIYYAHNLTYNIIVEVPASKVDFIEYDSSKYCEQYIFLTPYYSVDKITIDSTALSDAYVNAGFDRVKDSFELTVQEQKLTGVKLGSTGKALPDVSPDLTGISNFSHYYSVLLSLSTQFEIPVGVLDKIDLEKPDITLEIFTKSGKTHVMRFYLYNSRHAYYTLDGEGRSYVKYDDLVKLLDSSTKVIKGEKVVVGYTSGATQGGITSDKTEYINPVDTTSIVFLIIILVFVITGSAIAIIVTLKKVKNNGNSGSGKK